MEEGFPGRFPAGNKSAGGKLRKAQIHIQSELVRRLNWHRAGGMGHFKISNFGMRIADLGA